MSVDPVWFLLRVTPEETPVVKHVFEEAMQQSHVPEKARAFLDNRTEDLYGWSNLCFAYDLFYPDSVIKILDDIVADQSAIMPGEALERAILDYRTTDRESVTMILWIGLGSELASRLPGYFGNMFVPPEAVADVVQSVEQILEALNAAEFDYELDYQADVIAALGYYRTFPQALLALLLSSLRTVLREGNGLLTLNYPHFGAIFYLEEYEGG